MNFSLRFLASACLVSLLLCPMAQAAQPGLDKTPSELATDVGMVVLSGWGGASMVWGGATLATAEDGSWDAGFGRMNLIWGSVNLSIGLSSGIFSLIRAKRGWSEQDRLRYHSMKRTSLAVNLGLDVGYIAVGALLTRLGEVEGRDDLAGMGPALVIQGAVLAGLDAILLAAHLIQDERTSQQNLALGPGGLVVRF